MSYSRERRQPARTSVISPAFKMRLLIAGGIVLFSVVSFFNKGQVNPITGKNQWVDMTVNEEIRMGLQSAPQMGTPSNNRIEAARVSRIGQQLVSALNQNLYSRGIKNPYQFQFTLLADRRTVNAFALPGGQIFITEALYNQLSEAQVAGVLGHEIGHVVERHGSERMAKGNLFSGIARAAGVAGGTQHSANAAAYVGNIVNMKYGRSAELESDKWGVLLMTMVQHHPKHMITVMDVLERSAGGKAPPELLSSHPRPANRREYINKLIAELPQEMLIGLE